MRYTVSFEAEGSVVKSPISQEVYVGGWQVPKHAKILPLVAEGIYQDVESVDGELYMVTRTDDTIWGFELKIEKLGIPFFGKGFTITDDSWFDSMKHVTDKP